MNFVCIQIPYIVSSHILRYKIHHPVNHPLLWLHMWFQFNMIIHCFAIVVFCIFCIHLLAQPSLKSDWQTDGFELWPTGWVFYITLQFLQSLQVPLEKLVWRRQELFNLKAQIRPQTNSFKILGLKNILKQNRNNYLYYPNFLHQKSK